MDANPTFTARPSGTIGWEIVGPNGVVAWATEPYWAMLIAALLNRADEEGLAWKPESRMGGIAGYLKEPGRV
jgi:hypothetical protein